MGAVADEMAPITDDLRHDLNGGALTDAGALVGEGGDFAGEMTPVADDCDAMAGKIAPLADDDDAIAGDVTPCSGDVALLASG